MDAICLDHEVIDIPENLQCIVLIRAAEFVFVLLNMLCIIIFVSYLSFSVKGY